MALSKFPLEGWIFGAQKAKNETPPPPPFNSKTKSQRSEPKWLSKYLIIPNFCAKFQPNRLTTTFQPLSQTMTLQHCRSLKITKCKLDCCKGDLCNGARVPMVGAIMLLANAVVAVTR